MALARQVCGRATLRFFRRLSLRKPHGGDLSIGHLEHQFVVDGEQQLGLGPFPGKPPVHLNHREFQHGRFELVACDDDACCRSRLLVLLPEDLIGEMVGERDNRSFALHEGQK